MKLNLENIAILQTGVFAKPVKSGEIAYLQSKHFDENGQLTSVLYPDLKPNNQTNRHLLKPGDVLFAAKGLKNFSTLYESMDIPAVASTSFFVIRLQENFQSKVLPEYLVWFLNQPASMQFLKGKATGTSLPSISKTTLEELQISVPDLKTQKIVLKIAQLKDQEKRLKAELEILIEKKMQQQIINAINK
ncbi:restriction endonuclease subunit S [Ilyomonas limi]|uniref:restriction endonuclease subunit S n=1 Tax=Ilyomonas limi TaxID=2575867 RepID=UPI0014853995|nr:restriction endonuclease subunit S [Ilyomonas limi]